MILTAPAFLFVLAFVGGVVLLVRILGLASPSHEHCQDFTNTTLPSTPCEAEFGKVFVVSLTHVSEDPAHESFWLAVIFASGMISFGVLYAVLFARGRQRHAAKIAKMASRPSFFNRPAQPAPSEAKLGLFAFLQDSRSVMVVNTGLATASIAVWLGLVFFRTKEISTFLRTLDPALSRSEYIRVLTHYMCRYPYHATLTLQLEAFLTGCLFVSIVLLLLTKNLKRTDIFLGLLDIVNCLFVVYSLPSGYYVSSTRAYSLYMLNGFIRTLRTFYGVPEMARLHNLLIADPMDKRTANIKINVSFADRIRLLFGEMALGFKVGTFVFSSGLLMIAVEGMACPYKLPDRLSPCSCPAEMAEFVGGMYFITTVCATVGFGDFAPLTTGGRMVVIFVMLSGAYQLPDWLDHLKAHRTNRMLTKKLSIIQHNASRNDGTLTRKMKRSESSRDRLIRLLKRDSKEAMKRSQSTMSDKVGISSRSLGPNLNAGERGSLRGIEVPAGAGLRPGMYQPNGRLGMGAKIVGNLADVSGLVVKVEGRPESVNLNYTDLSSVNNNTNNNNDNNDNNNGAVAAGDENMNHNNNSTSSSSEVGREDVYDSLEVPNQNSSRSTASNKRDTSAVAVRMLSRSSTGMKLEALEVAKREHETEELLAVLEPRATLIEPPSDAPQAHNRGGLTETEFAEYCAAFERIENNNQRLRHNSLALQAVIYGLCSSLNSEAADRAHDLQQLRSTAMC